MGAYRQQRCALQIARLGYSSKQPFDCRLAIGKSQAREKVVSNVRWRTRLDGGLWPAAHAGEPQRIRRLNMLKARMHDLLRGGAVRHRRRSDNRVQSLRTL